MKRDEIGKKSEAALIVLDLYLHGKIPSALRAFIDDGDPVVGFVIGEFIDFASAVFMDAAAEFDIVFSVVVRRLSFVNHDMLDLFLLLIILFLQIAITSTAKRIAAM